MSSSPLGLNEIVDLAQIIEVVCGRALTLSESSRLKTAWQQAESSDLSGLLAALKAIQSR